MASVLVPYSSSDGNNPYTEAQLKELWKDIGPETRAPNRYTEDEKLALQKEFLTYIQEGYSATKAVKKLKAIAEKHPEKFAYADYATFMAWKAFDKDFAEAYELAYAMGTDNLEDKAVELAYQGNTSILQFLLRMRNGERYNTKSSMDVNSKGSVDHVHTINLVAADPLTIENMKQIPMDQERDHDIVDVETSDE